MSLFIFSQASMIHPIPESSISNSLFHHRTRLGSRYTDTSFEPCPNFTNTLIASRLCGTTIINSNVDHPSTSLLIKNNDENSCSSPVIIPVSLSPKQQPPSRSSPILFPIDKNTLASSSSEYSSQHVRTMKVIQSSSSSMSDFISSTPISILQNISKPINVIISF
jgi:hypothetical protein